jgi:hypothetical protein
MENQIQKDYTKFDEKTIATIKTSAIWSAVVAAIMCIASSLATYYLFKNLYNSTLTPYGQYLGTYMDQLYKPQMINMGNLLSSVIWGAVGGAIAGWIIAKFYPVFVGWQKKYLGNKLNSFFKILFWPYLVGVAISLILTGSLSTVYSGFTIFIIIAVADLVSIYLYAIMMEKTVGKYYK